MERKEWNERLDTNGYPHALIIHLPGNHSIAIVLYDTGPSKLVGEFKGSNGGKSWVMTRGY